MTAASSVDIQLSPRAHALAAARMSASESRFPTIPVTPARTIRRTNTGEASAENTKMRSPAARSRSTSAMSTLGRRSTMRSRTRRWGRLSGGAADPAVSLTNAAGDPIDPNNVQDGDELYLDLRGSTSAGAATVSVSATGASSTGMVVSVPNPSTGQPTADDHAQFIILVAPSTATTSGDATVEWAAVEGETPVIGTSLVDAADQDRVLAWNGGTVVDTVAHENLVPGTEYTVTGELMRKSDGSATGIMGSATFTPTEANGSVDVTFTVPEGYAGETLVAFEWLFEGTDTSGEPVAEHTDIDDAAQTIVVDKKPKPAGVVPTTATLSTTGFDQAPMLVTVAGATLLAGAVLLLMRSRKKI